MRRYAPRQQARGGQLRPANREALDPVQARRLRGSGCDGDLDELRAGRSGWSSSTLRHGSISSATPAAQSARGSTACSQGAFAADFDLLGRHTELTLDRV